MLRCGVRKNKEYRTYSVKFDIFVKCFGVNIFAQLSCTRITVHTTQRSFEDKKHHLSPPLMPKDSHAALMPSFSGILGCINKGNKLPDKSLHRPPAIYESQPGRRKTNMRTLRAVVGQPVDTMPATGLSTLLLFSFLSGSVSCLHLVVCRIIYLGTCSIYLHTQHATKGGKNDAKRNRSKEEERFVLLVFQSSARA